MTGGVSELAGIRKEFLDEVLEKVCAGSTSHKGSFRRELSRIDGQRSPNTTLKTSSAASEDGELNGFLP